MIELLDDPILRWSISSGMGCFLKNGRESREENLKNWWFMTHNVFFILFFFLGGGANFHIMSTLYIYLFIYTYWKQILKKKKLLILCLNYK
jgi:hypothetical protein